ncbi:tyrosine-type recombinase/integrase [Desulfocicer niacini]
MGLPQQHSRSTNKFRFSKTALDKLPPNAKDSPSREKEYSDQEVIGLKLLVSKNGRKFFHLRYRYNKRKRVISIGEYPAVSISDARQRANEFKNMLSRGIDPLLERNKQSDSITFAEFVTQEYIPFAKVNKKSWKDDSNKYEKDMKKAFGKLPLSAITTRDIQQYQTKIKARTSAGTSNRHYSLLSRIFNLAIEWGFLEKNPCKGVKKQKEAGGKERYLNKDELKRFLQALDEVEQSVSTHSIRFLLFSGARMSEALGLLWTNVDIEGGTALLADTKGGKARTITLNDLAKQVLVEMRSFKINKYVFPGAKANTHLASPRRLFETVKEKTGIGNFRIHDLRHSFASIAVNNGASLYEVQRLLGHASSNMTQRYAHLSDKAVRDATDGVAAQITEAVA